MGAMGFSIREGIRSVWRHRFVAVLSIITIASALFVLGFFLTVTYNLNTFLREAQQKISIEIFLTDNMKLSEVQNLKTELMRLAGVREVFFIDKESAKKRFEEKFGSNILMGLNENPFPPSMLVRLTPGTGIERSAKAVIETLKDKPEIIQVVTPGNIFKKISNLLQTFLILSLLWGVILLLGAIIIVINTIKLAIYGRRDSVEIMQLVGATDAFIRRPFMVEGFIQGILAGFLAAVTLVVAFWGVKQLVPAVEQPGKIIFWGIASLGAIFGLLGSRISVGKFLHRITD